MSDWQERITRETEPAIRAEHDLRYRIAAPLITGSASWCDVGCGTGFAAARALGERFDGLAVLADRDEAAVSQARAIVRAGTVEGLTADLVLPADLDRLRGALLAGPGPRTATCFEVIEHLPTFLPLLDLLCELAAEHETTVLLSVPNDAFWAIENPYHETMWGAGALEELRGLLPGDAVVVHQLALAGSGVVFEAGAQHVEAAVQLDDGVPTHFLAAFGPRAGELQATVAVEQVDLDEQRAWVRQRESDLLHLLAERDGWRDYIHSLEDRLSLPRSGTPERRAYDEGHGGSSRRSLRRRLLRR
ncbi:MAG: class I SAM-dependent methyltransferase [Solirubrobacterales bacterium]|nr:class I SAM-dependent methyltransferase [Solirubrobacterales bacterium]